MEISEKLRQEILSGKFDTTRKLPSEHQLMRRFSVACEIVHAGVGSTNAGYTLALMEDDLRFFKDHGLGRALWGLRGRRRRVHH